MRNRSPLIVLSDNREEEEEPEEAEEPEKVPTDEPIFDASFKQEREGLEDCEKAETAVEAPIFDALEVGDVRSHLAKRRKRLESQLFGGRRRKRAADGWPKQELKEEISLKKEIRTKQEVAFVKRELGQGRGAPECSTSTKQAVCRGPILAGPEHPLKRGRHMNGLPQSELLRMAGHLERRYLSCDSLADRFYLEEDELARQLVEIGCRKGEVLTREDFAARREAAENAKKARLQNAPKVLASAQKNLTDFPVLRHLACREESRLSHKYSGHANAAKQSSFLEEISGYIDYGHRLKTENFEPYFDRKKRLLPKSPLGRRVVDD
eukprot:g7545.t1